MQAYNILMQLANKSRLNDPAFYSLKPFIDACIYGEMGGMEERNVDIGMDRHRDG